MKQYDEAYCLAVLISSLKSRNRYPDTITVAECAKALYTLYSSYEKVALSVGVTPSVINKWVNLADAPKEFKDIVNEGKVFPVAAFEILFKLHDDTRRIEFIREVKGWGESEIVLFLKFVKQRPEIPISLCKEQFMAEIMNSFIRQDKK